MTGLQISEREELAQLALRLRAKGISDTRLFAALERVSRLNFVESQWQHNAYENAVLPIECGEYIERIDEQLILISALQLEKKHRVLEIGTGSGFTAALMASLAGRVTTIERYKTLCDAARRRFQMLALDNVILRQMDGSKVVPGAGPFDRIMIWPALEKEPSDFLELLAGNGVLIAPIGEKEGIQTMVQYTKTGSRFERADLFKVRYQPFIEGVAAAL